MVKKLQTMEINLENAQDYHLVKLVRAEQMLTSFMGHDIVCVVQKSNTSPKFNMNNYDTKN